jgi:LmbE family N-acetylglucosaminyl deacetylase
VKGAAGWIALHREDRDLRFVLLHATGGEAGEIASDAGLASEQLGGVRRREDEAGWRIIGRTPDRHEWLGFPAGRLADLPAGLLEAEIARVLAEQRPDVVLTFGPDGITDYPDHITLGAATTARSRGSPLAVDRVLHSCTTRPGSCRGSCRPHQPR